MRLDAQFLLAAVLSAAVAPAPKVPVTIMVEAYCPCSGAWPYELYTKLLPQIGELMELDRFFDASSSPLASQGCCNPSPNKTIPKSNVCFHGQNECVADRLQACAQALYPDKWLEFTVCINGPCAAHEGLDVGFRLFRVTPPVGLVHARLCEHPLLVLDHRI